MRTPLAALRVAALLSVTSACSLFLDYSGIADGCDAGCADATGDANLQDVQSEQDVTTSDGGCPAQGGPAPVRVGGFCIDSTEVTNGQYAKFLDAIGQGYTPDKPSGCGGKVSFAPAASANGCTAQTFDPVQRQNYPVGCVDWCDAWAFCAWSGKRLCGKVGGGPIPFDSNQVGSTEGEWYTACGGGGLFVFPWGSNSPDDSRCNTKCMPMGDGGAIPVGTDTTCTTPTGLADMGGNQSEWVNSCAGSAPGDFCFDLGDSFAVANGAYCGECAVTDIPIRGYAGVEMGIRCCADPL